ncbi:TetR/AcrR family transcriptional regulator [Mycolicibacterium stellerae]|uniref:TetR/AcrR family transcriptional regulator n=1 Tax=Mycolicibacterium stellerae TaxID=2358193 RepID=UPI000F0B6EB0|nr:TetR/AcrR family transcriptional regulator [Mycolicibacterium stellerae]
MTFDEATALRTASEQFRTTGYAAMSIDDQCAAAGLSRSSLYATFGDKRTLLLLDLSDDCAEIVSSVKAELTTGSPDARLRLSEFIRAAARAGLVDPQGCLLERSTVELAATDPQVVAYAADVLDLLHRLLADTVMEAQRHCSVHHAINCMAAASLLLATLRGISALALGGCTDEVVIQAAEQALSQLRPAPTDVGH